MQAIRMKATIDVSRRLQIDLPADTPVGEAKVIVLVSEAAAPPSSKTLRELLDVLDGSGRPRLAADEVEQWVESERNAWDCGAAAATSLPVVAPPHQS